MKKFFKSYESILVISLGFLLVSVIFSIYYILIPGVLIVLPAFIFPKYNQVVSAIWMKFSQTLGKISSTVLLSITFYILLTPIALIRRIFHPDSLHIRFKKAESYFHDRKHRYNKDDLINPW